ncbi:MAG: hypothetical protein Q9218_007456 [Villophora microphyllina]
MRSIFWVVALFAHFSMTSIIQSAHRLDVRTLSNTDNVPSTSIAEETTSLQPKSILRKRVRITEGITHHFVNYLVPGQLAPDQGWGWILRLKFDHAVQPYQVAAKEFIHFYELLGTYIEAALAEGSQWTWFAFSMGDITLKMRTRDRKLNLDLAMIRDLVVILKGFVERSMVGTFVGEVAADFINWTIWIALQIPGM